MFRPVRRALPLLALMPVLLLTGCGSDSTPTAPTTTVTTVTEAFEGTLQRNAALTHAFIVGTPGTVTVSLSSVTSEHYDSASPTVIGFSLGTWNTTTELCQVVLANDQAIAGRIIVGTAQNSGAFCVRVYDVGRITEPTSYTLTVVHN